MDVDIHHLPRSNLHSNPSLNITSDPPTIKQAENSEVSPDALVAVAVITSPACTSPGFGTCIEIDFPQLVVQPNVCDTTTSREARKNSSCP